MKGNISLKNECEQDTDVFIYFKTDGEILGGQATKTVVSLLKNA